MLTILSDRIYVQTIVDNDVGQIVSINYSILAPVIVTMNILSNNLSAENITQIISSIDSSTNRSETVGFNAVGMLK